MVPFMPIVTSCTGCEKKFRVADKLVGKSVKCPHCAQKVKVVGNSPQTATKTTAKKPQTSITVNAQSATAPASAAPSKTKLAKAPASQPSLAVGTKPLPEKKKPAPAVESPASKPSPPPREQPKIEAPKPTPNKRKNDDDDDGSGSRRMILLLSSAALLAVVGMVVAYYSFFSEPPLGNVSGTVLFESKPLEQALVVYLGTGTPKAGPFQSPTSKDGSYRLYGNTGKGIPPGKYKVTVSKLVMPNGSIPEGPAGEMAREQGALRELLPAEYSVMERTKLEADVKTGSNDIHLTVTRTP